MNNRFSITKFCEKKTCQTSGYSKVVTAGNDPTISKKMRFSQYIRSVKPRTITTTDANPSGFDRSQPYYFQPFGVTRATVNPDLNVYKL